VDRDADNENDSVRRDQAPARNATGPSSRIVALPRTVGKWPASRPTLRAMPVLAVMPRPPTVREMPAVTAVAARRPVAESDGPVWTKSP